MGGYRLNPRIATFDFDILWTDYSDEICELVPITEREGAILLSLLRFGHWSARWFSGDDLLRDIGRQDDLDNGIAYIETLERKLLMSGCLDGLIEAIDNLSSTVRLSSCCTASLPLTTIGEGEYYGSEEPLEEPTSFGEGEEFETENDYLAHKCEAANAIVDGLIQTLNNLAVLSFVSITAGAILLAIASPVISPIPLAVFLALGLTGFLIGGLHTLANAIDDNREEIVCLLYNTQTATAAYDALHDFVHELSVDLLFLEIEITAIDEIIAQLTPLDTMNVMYRAVALPEIGTDPIDCAVCECPDYTVLWGSWDEGTNRITSEVSDNHQRAAIVFNAASWSFPTCGEDVSMTVSIISGTPGAPDWGYRFLGADGTVVYEGNTPPSYPITCSAVYLKDYIPYSVIVAEITIS